MTARNENLRKLERVNVALVDYHRWLGHEFPEVERVLENLFIEFNSRPITGGEDVSSFRSVGNLRDELRAMRRDRPRCPSCGTHEVSQQQTCHNSACEAYARDVTIYEGWNVQKSSLFASEPGGKQELPRKLGAEPPTRPAHERHAEALRGLRNLKVLLGIDAPEVRGWAPAVQQAARHAVNAAIRVLVENGNG